MDYKIDNQTLVFQLKDKLIMGNSDKVKNDIKRIIEDVMKTSALDSVNLDLKGVDFIDSTGVGVFISIYKFLVERNLHFKLLHPQEIVSKVLTITKIGSIIEIEK